MKSVPFGMYCRISLFSFSIAPFCQSIRVCKINSSIECFCDFLMAGKLGSIVRRDGQHVFPIREKQPYRYIDLSFPNSFLLAVLS